MPLDVVIIKNNNNTKDKNTISSLTQQLDQVKIKCAQLNVAKSAHENTITTLNQQLAATTKLQQVQLPQLQQHILPKLQQLPSTLEQKENSVLFNPKTWGKLSVNGCRYNDLRIKRLTQNKFAMIERVDDSNRNATFYVSVFETRSDNGKLIAQGSPITIPQPYTKCGGHNDIYIWNESTIITSTCPYDSSCSRHKSLFTLIKVNGVNVTLKDQKLLAEKYIAQGGNMHKIGYDRLILTDCDGRIKILKISGNSITDGKFYQFPNKKPCSTTVKLTDSKLVRFSSITNEISQAAVISVSEMNLSEGTPYIIKQSAQKYGLSDSKCLVSYTTSNTWFVRVYILHST